MRLVWFYSAYLYFTVLPSVHTDAHRRDIGHFYRANFHGM